jgi:hypothetical protein
MLGCPPIDLAVKIHNCHLMLIMHKSDNSNKKAETNRSAGIRVSKSKKGYGNMQ